MKTTVRNITLKALTYLMIGMMGLLITNKAVFMHVHKMGDGIVVIHSHPYDKSNDSKPYKSHHHTKADLLFFDNLEILFLFILLPFILLNLVKNAKYLFYRITNCVQTCIILHKGRAPPLS